VQHELFEYEGRISQLVRLVEIDMPQALGVLGQIVRRLEEYQSGRAGQPGRAYNDVSFARELWPDGEAASPGLSLSKSAAGEVREDATTSLGVVATPETENRGAQDAEV
jgi:hypothetical protein